MKFNRRVKSIQPPASSLQPNLTPSAKIRRLELRTKQLVESSFAGQYQSVFKGQGMNFEERGIPENLQTHAKEWHDKMVESAAESSEELINKTFKFSFSIFHKKLV